MSPRRFRRQSASPARPKKPDNAGGSRRPAEQKSLPPKPAQPREKVQIPLHFYPVPEKEITPPPRLIPINKTEEKMMSSYETSWNDRYMFEPIGPTLGRENIITEDTDNKLAHKESVYKQQIAESSRNSFLGKTVESSQSYYSAVNGSEERMLDSRGSSYNGSSYNGSGQDSLMQNGRTSIGSQRNSIDNGFSSTRNSMENGKSFTQSSSSYSSYKKTNINGQESSSSSHYEKHSDSRDRNGEDSAMHSSRGNSSVNTTAANMLERQRRESSRKSSLAGYNLRFYISPSN